MDMHASHPIVDRGRPPTTRLRAVRFGLAALRTTGRHGVFWLIAAGIVAQVMVMYPTYAQTFDGIYRLNGPHCTVDNNTMLMATSLWRPSIRRGQAARSLPSGSTTSGALWLNSCQP